MSVGNTNTLDAAPPPHDNCKVFELQLHRALTMPCYHRLLMGGGQDQPTVEP